MSSPAPAGDGEIVVSAHDLSRSFGDFVAVDRVSFEVTRGEIFGFLGSNGAGKTTTIRMLCGLLAPTSGSGTVAGYDIATQADRVKTRIGYMSQRFSLYADLTVDENLRFWGGAYGLWGDRLHRRREWAVEAAGLEQRRHSLVRDLPGGFRQRLALGSALLHEPPVVFLDEPTGGVDPEARRRFWDLIDDLVEAGTTVFVTTHSMDEAERCHRVALMHAGELLALDTVPALKDVFPKDCVLEVGCPRAADAMERLEEVAGVEDVSLFGDRLHVVVDRPDRIGDVETELDTGGFTPFEVRAVTPSLEDVFIKVIRDADAGEGT
ncbi:MAG TPA: ABC transporter ATP-binding protein [Methylomirabilota bacterium]|nr:ABC transporter ATP-binding protein [Methylomirabilota bacterium]